MSDNHCTAHDLKKESTLLGWIESLDGKSRVAKMLGIDVSTLYRYGAGKQEVPKWLLAYKKMSEDCARLRQENAKLKREMRSSGK